MPTASSDWEDGWAQSRSENCGEAKVFARPGNELQCSDRPGLNLVALLTQIRRAIIIIIICIM